MNQSNTPEFFATQCPSCSGNLQLPTGYSSVKCMYCQSTIYISHLDGGYEVKGFDLDHVEELMVQAYGACNYRETIRLANKILEESRDENQMMAWVFKGLSAGHLSTEEDFRLDEMLFNVRKCIDSVPPEHRGDSDKKSIEHLVAQMLDIVTHEFIVPLMNKWHDESERNLQSAHMEIQLSQKSFIDQLLIARGVGSLRLKYVQAQADHFVANFLRTILQIVEFSWQTTNVREIAERILMPYLFFLKNSTYQDNWDVIKSSFRPVVDEIRAIYPSLEAEMLKKYYSK